MPLGHAAQLPQGVLHALAQTFKALREADRRRLPVRVRQHEVIDQVIETLALDGDVQAVHRREVGRAQPSRFVDLSEEDFLGRSLAATPALDVPLQRPQLRVGETPRILPLQLAEDRLGLQPRIEFQQTAHLGPNLLEGIGPGPPVMRRRDLAGQSAQTPVFTCCLVIHVCQHRCLALRLAIRHQAEQLLDLLVRDHRNPPCAKKLRVSLRTARAGKSNCRQPALLIVVGRIIVVATGKSNCRQTGVVVVAKQ